MILCRIPDDGSRPQFYEVEDVEVSVYKLRGPLDKAIVPRKVRGWRFNSYLGAGAAGFGNTRAEAENAALEAAVY